LLAFFLGGTAPFLIFMTVLHVFYFGAAGLAGVGADDVVDEPRVEVLAAQVRVPTGGLDRKHPTLQL